MANEKEVDCIGSVLKGAVNSSSLSFPSYTPDSRERERERGRGVILHIYQIYGSGEGSRLYRKSLKSAVNSSSLSAFIPSQIITLLPYILINLLSLPALTSLTLASDIHVIHIIEQITSTSLHSNF